MAERKEFAAALACIRCGACVGACPIHLLPCDLSTLGEAERFDLMPAANIWDCIECGSCSFVCPAHRPIVHQIRLGKVTLNKLRQKEQKKAAAKASE